MISFRRAFIAATLVGVSAGFLFQRCVQPGPDLPTVGPTAQTLPVPAPVERENSLAGRILDAEGRPAVGASVIATTARGVRAQTTDEDGRFQLRGLGTGEARIDVVQHGYAPQWRQVMLPSAEIVEWTLSDPFDPVEALPRIDRSDLRGRLVPAPAAPGHEVWIAPRGDLARSAWAGVVDRRAAVDADGGFLFEGLAHGEYRLSLLPPFARGSNWPRLVTLDLDHLGGEREVDLPSASSSVFGRLTDTLGAPVEGALIAVSAIEDPDHIWPLERSDNEGRFRVGNLVDGSYRLTVRAGDAELERLLRVARGVDQEVQLAPLDVQIDATVPDLQGPE